jgi:Polyketide cyclase / dehydrase and lipid transport
MANDDLGDKVKDAGESIAGSNGNGFKSALSSKELLVPAALSAVAAVAATKGPDLVRRVGSGAAQKGEQQARKLGEQGAEGAKDALKEKMGGGLLGKLLPGGGGGDGGKSKKTRRLPIQRWTDIALPVDQVYAQWIKFDEYPKFMHRVLSVQKEDDNSVRWEEKIWFSRRQWEAKVTDRRKNDRIAWKTVSGMNHSGIVSFHALAPNLTRVMVTVDFQPTGMLEKMASGLRFVKRAVQADLARFKAFVEMEHTRGLEYDATKGQNDDESEREDESKRDEPQQPQAQEAGSDSGRRSGRDDDNDRDSERRERESHRRERREALTR